MSNFVNRVHIIGRYPELAEDKDFLSWMQTYDGDVWHETPATEDGHTTVVVQSNNRLNLFAVLIQRDMSGADKGIIENKVVQTANIDLTEQGLTPNFAAMMVRKESDTSNDQIHAIRPVVNFEGNEPQVSWEVEVLNNDVVQIFKMDKSENLARFDVRELKKTEYEKPEDNPIPPANDWLGENECHHLSTWRTLARQMTASATTVADQAFAIWIGVRDRMRYDATITHISEFTWSDNLVIDQNGWRGICDEWAVVQITLLRALGIPAGMKFLIWQSGGKGVGHACLEWSDNGNWRHMDALWNAFDNRAVYRQRGGATNVTVMDGTYPMDSRYNGLAWEVVDQPGDQKFYPYGDFIINPAYPGNQRPGYSY